MKFEIRNRFSGKVQFTAEIDCDESTPDSTKIGFAVIWAIKNKVDLIGADLRGADLRDEDLKETILRDTNLERADLRGADLEEADLTCANLTDADLEEANIIRADLSGAILIRADLTRADLEGTILGETNTRSFKHDLWGILIRFKHEIPQLITYIKDGKINGSCYSGNCSCLMGTFAKIKKCDINDDQFSIKDSYSPAEQWFSMIKPGHTPENSFASKMALEWIEEFLDLLK